jgi:DNA-binding NtrC family response regulator
MTQSNQIRILLIEDEDFDVRRVENTIKLFDDKLKIVDIVSNGTDALKLIRDNKNRYDIVIMDYQIAGALRGEELIIQIKQLVPVLQIIVITKLTINISDFNFAQSLMNAGAFWYCTKYPGDIENYIYQPTDFLMALFNAYDKRKLEVASSLSNQKLQKNIDDILESKKIISISPAMEELRVTCKRLAENDFNILINGASGTGKELVAYNIHYNSNRKFENFVPINCGSIPTDLIESELFGYEKGSFTGASGEKPGLFEAANKGTIFLDEIGELPLKAQVKLLRVIQDGEIEKIGRTKSIKVDVRVIAATNKNLEEEISKGNFREDLFYRLNVVPLFIPALKKRKEDIRVLADHFISTYRRQMGILDSEIDSEAYEILESYEWPGNIRELKNVAQRIAFNSKGKITGEDVEASLIRKTYHIQKSQFSDFYDANNLEQLKDVEKKFRKEYFKFVRDNSASDADAAAKLGLAPPNYHRMCKELGLK